MKTRYIITWMSASLCCGAEDTATIELVRPIFEASDKSFPDLVHAATSVEIPALTLPINDVTTSPINAVSTLVWKRLSTLEVVVTPANKAEKLEVMQAMGRLYSWLLKREAYANMAFAVYIEDTVTMSALCGLAEGEISTEEARKLLAALAPDISVNSMVSVVRQTVPQSEALEKMKNTDPDSIKLLTISNLLGEEIREYGVRTVKDLAQKERPASIAICVALSSTSKHLARFLIEYADKGGSLNLSEGSLAKEFERLIPEAIGVVDPASGLKIEALMVGGLMGNVAEWKTLQ